MGIAKTAVDSIVGRIQRAKLLKRMPKQSVCAEIGVWKGGFSSSILRVVQPTCLHLIDPWKHQEGEQYLKAWFGTKYKFGQKGMDKIHARVVKRYAQQIQRGTVTVDRGTASEAFAKLPDAYFDWVYIDGNHLYDYVKEDLAVCLAKVKPGGYITGDDYGKPGWWQDGVKLAVDEMASTDKVEKEAILGHQFILKKL